MTYRRLRMSIHRLLRLAPLLIVLLFGCRRHDDGVVIEFWTLQLSPTFNDYFNRLIATYERLHPGVRIRWVDVPYDAAVQKLLSSAVAGNAPDVVNLSADFLAKFNGMHACLDLAPAIARCGYTFLPNALDICTCNGTLAGIPWYLNTYVVLCNTRLIRAAGFSDRTLPRTYAELVPFVRQYKDRTGKFALFWNIGKDSYLPMMLGSEGIPMTDSALTHATFNTDRGVALVDQWVQLYRGGYLPRESVIKPGSAVVEAYQSGQVAMLMTGPVFLKRIRTNAPAIYAETAVAPAIVGTTGMHELAAMSISVLSTSAHPKEATDFALFVTNPENQLAFSRMTTTLPSVVEALRDPFFTTEDGSLETQARVLSARQLPFATRLQSHLLDADFDVLRDAFDEAIQKACFGELSTREALDRAARTWDGILRKNRR